MALTTKQKLENAKAKEDQRFAELRRLGLQRDTSAGDLQNAAVQYTNAYHARSRLERALEREGK